MLYLPTSRYAAQVLGSVSNIVTGAPFYFVTGASFSMWPASAPAATFQVALSDSVEGTIFIGLISAATTQTGVMQLITPPGFFFKSKNAASSLNFSISTPITGGGIAVSVYFGQTSI